MILTIKCIKCEKEFKKSFPDEKISRVIQGKELIQKIFPELSSEDRELYFISHLCPDCWNSLFHRGNSIKNQEEEYFTDEDIENIITEHYQHLEDIKNGK